MQVGKDGICDDNRVHQAWLPLSLQLVCVFRGSSDSSLRRESSTFQQIAATVQAACDNTYTYGTAADIHSGMVFHAAVLRMSLKFTWAWMDCGNRAGVVRGCLLSESVGTVAVVYSRRFWCKLVVSWHCF